jgi:16S rRNA (cytidine1402-2'-O)-methyltransferase
MTTLEPGLYVAATPIGNLGDVTYRVIETLRAVDRILCEDTRQTAKLCAAYGIATQRAPYHEHNAAAVRPGLIEELKAGARFALVSDGGTPLISDPGFKLVADAREAGVRVTPLPGPCAAIAALSASGSPTDRFLFAGFPPAKAGQRAGFLKGLAGIDATLVFYESPSRVADTLRAMAAALGERRAVVAREMTKIYESIESGDLASLADRYDESEPRGEFVIIVDPPPAAAAPDEADIDAFIVRALNSMSVREAAAAAADALGVPRKAAYERALAMKERK